MARDLRDQSEAAQAVFARAENCLDPALFEAMFEGPDETLKDTRNAQPALVLHGAAAAEHLKSAGIEPTVCAGHSVGEIGALYACESLTLQDALNFVVRRAELMATESPEGGMAAVLGLAPEAIEAALPDGVDVANYNGPGQTIVSGPHDALESAISALKQAGAKRVLPLPVSGPFHSRCMRDAGEKLRTHIDAMPVRDPAIPFVSSVTGTFERSADAIREALSLQLYSPVRWTETMLTIGPVDALETGPGSVLQGLAKRTEGAPGIRPAGTIDAIAAL